ncbi:MAG TPA: TetR/AcrR family transcriptional regulator [Lachnospiraceae bacterium]|nr:TetR/AcrR family transcriptional regulator [Lachnospiraceae bacterium]
MKDDNNVKKKDSTNDKVYGNETTCIKQKPEIEQKSDIKQKASTKAHILEVALDLFSKRGYSSVSIRDICGKVGIKESSVYYHFKSKMEIFDELCKYITDVTNSMSQNFDVKMSEAITVTEEEFLAVCQSYLNYYLMDGKINRFIRMLIIEQSTNPQAAELYHKVLFDKALEGQQAIFEWLIRIGFLKDSNVECMVLAYYAPFVYYFHRYLVTEEITEEIREEVNQNITKHVQHFLSIYKQQI